MKQSLLATVALAALTVGPTMAADMRVKAPALPPPVPVWTWTGCYLGGHGGVLLAEKDFVDRTPESAFFDFSRGDHEIHGLLGGVQAGCDVQFAGFVVGIQGDYAWTDAEGSHLDLLDSSAAIRTRIKSLATVTGRLGYAWDRFLFYVKGGGAWERDDYDVVDAATLETFAVANEKRSGWTVGLGGEYAFTDWLSGFVEYNYYDFETRDVIFASASGETSTINIKEAKSVARAGVNFRFGGGKAPIAARY
jgi:outer membrane immunogenic protein